MHFTFERPEIKECRIQLTTIHHDIDALISVTLTTL